MIDRRTSIENLLIAGCACSGGVHAALVPEHLRESPIVGVGFAVAAVLLLLAALAISAEPSASRARASAGLLTLLIVAYGASRTVGLPIGGLGVEDIDALGLATQAVQAAGVAAALALSIPRGESPRFSQRKEVTP